MLALKNIIESLTGKISLSLLIYILFLFVLRLLLKQIIKKLSIKRRIVFKNILQAIYNPLFLAISAATLSIVIEKFSTFLNFQFSEWVAINVILTLSAGWFLYNVVNAFYEIYTSKLEDTEPPEMKQQIITQLTYIRRVAHFLVILFTIAIVLLNFPGIKSVALTALASAGVLTAIIGFSSQNTISTLIDGFQIIFVQPIRINDTVMVDDILGTVEEINLTYLIVRSWDKKGLIIPISRFFKSAFQNLTYNTQDLIGVFILAVNLNIDVNKVRHEFERLLAMNPRWTKSAKNFQVADQDSFSMKLKCLYTAKTPGELNGLECELREQLIHFLKENFREPFPIKLYRSVNITQSADTDSTISTS